MREKWRVGKQIEKWRVSKQELAAAVASRSVRAYPAMMGSDGIRQRGEAREEIDTWTRGDG